MFHICCSFHKGAKICDAICLPQNFQNVPFIMQFPKKDKKTYTCTLSQKGQNNTFIWVLSQKFIVLKTKGKKHAIYVSYIPKILKNDICLMPTQ